VNEFAENCFSENLAISGDWYQISKEFDPSLQTYYETIASLLGDQIKSHSHFAKFVDGNPIFLTRYYYEGQFGMASQVCMVSDFAQDSWEFPASLETFLDGKILKTDHSVNVVDQEKSVGHWRAAEDYRPVSMITASSIAKDSQNHIDSQFYGIQLTTTQLVIISEDNTLN